MYQNRNDKQNSFKASEAELLLKEIEQLLNPIRKRAKYVEYGTGSKSIKEPATQFTMNYGKHTIKVQILKTN